MGHTREMVAETARPGSPETLLHTVAGCCQRSPQLKPCKLGSRWPEAERWELKLHALVTLGWPPCPCSAPKHPSPGLSVGPDVTCRPGVRAILFLLLLRCMHATGRLPATGRRPALALSHSSSRQQQGTCSPILDTRWHAHLCMHTHLRGDPSEILQPNHID